MREGPPRQVRWAIACAVALGGATGAQTPAASVAPTDRIEGRVVDAMSQPLVAAEVWVTDPDDRVVARTKTDGEGMFIAAKLVPRSHWHVRATAADRVVGRELARPRGGISSVQLQLHDAATLRGRVVAVGGGGGGGIAGAEVIAAFDLARGLHVDAPRGITDAEGRFRLDKVPLGIIDVRAAATGFVGGGTRAHVARDRDVDVQLTAGDGLAIDVEIEGLTAAEAATVRVDVSPYGSGRFRRLPRRLLEGAIDPSGRWSVRGLPELEYRVSLGGPGLSFEPRYLLMYSQFSGSPLGTGQLPTTSPVAHFRAFRTNQVAVSGRLVDVAGEGLAGETLVVCAVNGGNESTAITGERGAFTIQSPLAPGVEAVFFLRRSKWVAHQERAHGDSDRRNLLWHRCPIDPQTHLVIRAIPATTVRGRLIAPHGQPVSCVSVQLQAKAAADASQWDMYSFATSRADGTFELAVHAMAQPARVLVEDGAGFAESGELRLEPGAAVEVGELKLAPPASITGIVRDAEQQPVAGARVWLRPWNLETNQDRGRSLREALSDRSGRYHFAAVPTGGAMLHVTLEGDYAEQPGAQPFEVKAGAEVSCDLVIRGP